MRVLVADALTIFCSGVQTLLARESDFEVVKAADLDELLSHIAADCPDIALIDLDLPPLGGVEAVASLTERCTCHTIVWSFHPDPETVLDAIRAGADGYLEKTISPAGLVRSLRGLQRGEAPLSRDLATAMIDALHRLEQRRRVHARAAVLSPREREVLSFVAEGARNKQIAEALFISEFTVKRHVQNILSKLGVQSRRAAGAFYLAAYREGASA
jgi:DNA-binding NarL/FixJ family response regulator